MALAEMLAFWLLYRLSRRPLRAALSHTGMHTKLVDLLIDGIYIDPAAIDAMCETAALMFWNTLQSEQTPTH